MYVGLYSFMYQWHNMYRNYNHTAECECFQYISTVVGFYDSSPSCEVDDDETQQIQIHWRSSYSQRHVLDQNTQYQARKLCSHGCYRCVCVFETW